MSHRTRLAAAAAWLVLGAAALAQDKADVPVIDKIWHAHHEVDRDGRVTQTIDARYQVLQQGFIERAKVYTFSYSTSIQTGEVLEAYTLKADGRRIPVPPGNFQRRVNEGRQGDAPAFSDDTSLSVVFPDFAVGDAVHIRYRIAEKEPMFPGHFSQAFNLSPFGAHEDVRVSFSLPADMMVNAEAHHMQAVPAVVSQGRRVLAWTYSNPRPRRYDEERDEGIWSIKESPGVLVSTFKTYEGITRAYGDRALPKAVPTSRVRELVATIVAGETRPREKARRLYEWVSQQITYAGNCIGVGAVVPRDQVFVLDNRMGDCKDHATLLQAMLAAADVRSEQVLVNAGSVYELPGTPVISMVNHVLNYLPDFDLYVDATAKEIPFGYLPVGLYSKPVLHVGRAKAEARIPGEPHQANQQRLAMNLSMAGNGSAKGSLRVSIKGVQAAMTRAYMRDLSADAERDHVRQALQSVGLRGRGQLEKGDVKGLSDEYAYAVNFEIDNFLRGGATGAFHLAPVLGSPLSVMRFAGVQERPMPTRPELCHGFHSSETLELELPAGMEILSMPESATLRGTLIDYEASYQKTPTGLKVLRELHDKTPGSICPPAVSAEFTRQALPVGENLRTQVLYKRAR